MSAAAILTLLGIANGLITLAKGMPDVVTHIKAILDMVRPYVKNAGVECATAFAQAEERFASI